MKNIKKTWFLSHPIDQEHKEYLLLDFLKSVNKDIKENEIYYSIKKIFSLTKELAKFKRWMDGKELDSYPESDKEIYEFFKKCNFTEQEKQEIYKIAIFSLDALYKYSELGIDLWRSLQKRIIAFDLQNGLSEESSGILILRNMATDEIFPYIWSRGDLNSSSSVIMKKVNLRNNFYSLSYQFVVHEIADLIGITSLPKVRVTVMEIQEDFNQDSIIVKIAKEIFVGEISQKADKKHSY
jgi:hypothetical protein